MITGNYAVRDWTDDTLVLERSKQNAILFLILYATGTIWLVYAFISGSLIIAALGGFIWLLLLVFGCASYVAYRAAVLVWQGDRLIFDRERGLYHNDRLLVPLADIRETEYEKAEISRHNRQTSSQRMPSYRLFLVFEEGNRLPLCSGGKIEALEEIADKLEEIFAIPINLDGLTPTF